MASENDGLNDDLDSLFEGMVLFNSSSSPFHNAIVDDDDRGNHQDGEHNQPIVTVTSPAPPPLPPRTTNDGELPPPSPSASSSSQALDENLFSDLTLVTPPLQPQTLIHPSSVSPTTTTKTGPSRQSSTRKKKKAGLRIGYGREGHTPDDHADSPSPGLGISSSSEIIQSRVEPKEDEAAANAVTSPSSSLMPNLDLPPPSPEMDAGLSSETSMIRGIENGVLSHNLQQEQDKKEAIDSKFEGVKAQVLEKLKHARELVDSVSSERKVSIKKRRKAAEDVRFASIKYKELEKLLEAACEDEDFETADRVSESLSSAEKDKESLAIVLRDAEADCDAIELKMQEVLECQILVEEESASLLEQLAQDATNNADLVHKNTEELSTKEMDEWNLSTEAVELKRMELEIESDILSGSRLVLNESIDHSVESDRRERELLYKNRERLTEELAKLLALVKEKEAEIAENCLHIDMIEQRIANVVSNFQELQLTVDTKYTNLQQDLSQTGLDNEALAKRKEQIDDLLSKEKDREAKLRELAHAFADEANMYYEVVGIRKTLLLSMLKSREDKARLAKIEEKLTRDVQLLRQDVSGARTALQELSSRKSCMQQEIESLQQRLVLIDKRVPELEADKKVAAAARNFKEAARIASEAKAMCIERESVQIKLEESILELGKVVEEEIRNTVSRLEETEEQISSKEVELAAARFHRLLLIAATAKSERCAALELGDLVEADILLAEAESADSEARKLQPDVYNINKDEEDFLATLPKHFISIELISKLNGKRLAELAAAAAASQEDTTN